MVFQGLKKHYQKLLSVCGCVHPWFPYTYSPWIVTIQKFLCVEKQSFKGSNMKIRNETGGKIMLGGVVCKHWIF